MHTDIRSAKTQRQRPSEYTFTHWLITLLIGLTPSSSPIATTSVNPDTEVIISTNTPMPRLRIAIAEKLQEPLKNDIERLRKAFHYAGYQLQLVPLPAERALRKAAAGELDGEFLRRREDVKAYYTLLPIDEPLRDVELWIWMKSDRQCPDTLQNLHEYSKASVLSYEFIKTLPFSADSRNVQTNSIKSSLLVLMAGRVDYVMFDKVGMAHYKKKLYLDVKTCFSKPLSSAGYFTFLHNKHRDKLPALAEALRRVKSEQPTQ